MRANAAYISTSAAKEAASAPGVACRPPLLLVLGYLTILVIVFLTIDVAAGTLQFFVELLALSGGELSVGTIKPLIDSNPRLLRFQSACFGPGQFAAPDALPDPLLLSMFDMVDCFSRREGRGCTHSKT
jgi:hypothetical protein